MAVKDWSTTAASNTAIISGMSLDGTVMTVNQTDNAFRDMAAQIASQLGKLGFKGADIASATTTNLANATGWYVDITGTTTITGLGTVAAGQMFMLRFSGALILTHNATSLILPGGANITTVAGDVAIVVSLGSGNWRCVSYMRSSSLPLIGPTSTDNAAARYDGTSGTLQNSAVIIDDSNNVSGVANFSLSGSFTYSATDFLLAANTSDASDTKSVGIAGGGTASQARGGRVEAFGNEHASFAGQVRIFPGTGAVINLGGDTTVTGNITSVSDGFHTNNKTASDPSTVGASMISSGQVNATVSADTCQILNRTGSDGTVVQIRNDNTTVGTISFSGSTTAYNTSSDGNLKTNLRPFDGGAIIDAIETWLFDWKSGGSGYGVIAQDAHLVFPDAITAPEGEAAHWSADYSKFVPLLLAEVKALRARVTALEA